MSRFTAAILGAFAFAPWAAVLLVPTLWPTLENPTYEQARADHDLFGSVIATTMVVTLGVMAIFIWYTFKGGTVPPEKRRLWAALLLLGNMTVLPFFWLWYVWRPATERRDGA